MASSATGHRRSPLTLAGRQRSHAAALLGLARVLPLLPPTKRALKPGETITLYNFEVAVEPEDRRAEVLGEVWHRSPTICAAPGKYKIAYGDMLQSHPKVATGTVEFEVKPASVTAWGKEIGGLQAGLGYRPGEKRAYSHGETVTLVVRVRNVGKEEVRFQYLRQFFIENPPTVTNGTGNVNQLGRITAFGTHIPVEVNLAAGKEIELYEWKPYLGSGTEEGIPKYPYIFGTGKFQVQYEKVFGNSSSGTIKIDPALDKLATGKLEIEVKEPEKMPPEKETFTAWGKEINGLQAGLGFRAGEKRAYHHGEGVAVVLRVRNVGKEAVEFKHIYAFFVENPPTITDADGKIVKLPPGRSLGLEQGAALPLHRPRSTNLSAGDEADIYKWEFDLQPKGGIGINKEVLAIHGTGKFSVQCEHVVGPTFGNPNHPDPTLDKLATGKLELEVKEAEKLPEKKEKQGARGAKLQPGTQEKLEWGEPVNGLRLALAWPPTLGEPAAGDVPDFFLAVQNVSTKPVRLCTTADAPNTRRLTISTAGVPQSRTESEEPSGTDVTLEPREVVFLRLFPEQAKQSPDQPSRGALIAAGVRQIPTMTVLADMEIKNAPAGAWTGKLITPNTRAGVDAEAPKNQKAQE